MDTNNWHPDNPADWERSFGFVPQPLARATRDVTVLRDGTAASFALKAVNDPSQDISKDIISQVWSADVRHLVCIHRDEMSIWQWDRPQRRVVTTAPRERNEARKLVEGFARTPRPTLPNVRQHVLQAFREIRSRVHDPTSAVVLLHALLSALRNETAVPADFSASALYASIAQNVPQNVLGEMSTTTRDIDLRDVADYLLRPSAIGLRLDSAVLLAHVSSRLFQEAHLDLERQGFFLGMSPEPSGKPKSSEIRYTPVNLARLLVQTALRSWSGPGDPRLLDPACGSGAFLLEAVNEIARSYRDLNPSLSGFDVSAPAVAIAHTCVRQAAEMLNKASVDVRCLNALDEAWPDADIVVMNPPFRAWKDMDADDRARVMRATGSKRRNDKSLAFLHKAWESLRPGGILTSVLPAPLLLSDGMAELQSKLESEGEVLLIGRLEGYTYFTNAIVETAFIVVRKTAPSSESMTLFALGTRKHEDEAIREIRMNRGESTTKVAEIYPVAQNRLTDTGWLPRPRRLVELLEWARRSALPTVSDTFSVHQGVRTGLKAAFVLSDEDRLALPKKERTFFRPAAGQGSVHSGVLTRPLYVFYPYSGAGTTIATEDALLESVPKYYERFLEPQRARLGTRMKIREWWLPTWPRNWQHERERKIVSTYFGLRGSFAVDSKGDSVVVDGFGWLLKGAHNPAVEDLACYLPILNSAIFEDLVSALSWRLQGGQLRLEPKYIKCVPLPRVEELPPSLRANCCELGMRIATESIAELSEEIESIARDCYGMPESGV